MQIQNDKVKEFSYEKVLKISSKRAKCKFISKIAIALFRSKWEIYHVLAHDEDFKWKFQLGRIGMINCHEDHCIRNLASIANYLYLKLKNANEGQLLERTIHSRVLEQE